ncbi:hypothetical protein ACFS07_05030 [Undibacterium arcticum]
MKKSAARRSSPVPIGAPNPSKISVTTGDPRGAQLIANLGTPHDAHTLYTRGSIADKIRILRPSFFVAAIKSPFFDSQSKQFPIHLYRFPTLPFLALKTAHLTKDSKTIWIT